MLKRFSPLLFLAFAVVGVPLAGLAQATFRQYTYVADNGPVNVLSITSPAIPLVAGDFVYVFCRSNTGPRSIAVTSSPSNTFRSLTLQNNGSSIAEQASYATSVVAGPTTFTCTPSIGVNYQSMIVLDYGVSPDSSALDAQAGGTNAGESTYTSPSFSTLSSSAELIIMCGTVGSASYAFTAGSIGSLRTTLRGVSASSLKHTADAACEDAIARVPQRSIKGGITYGSRQPWAATVGTFELKGPARQSPKVH